jgi:D-lactate dehydrogenase (cytochrome)
MSQHTSEKQVIEELRRCLGGRVSTSEAIRGEHAKDVSHHPPHLPDAVVFPDNNEAVSQIVQSCAKYRTPIVPFGTGTGVEGAVVPTHGGICVDFSEMNHILRVSRSDMDATVQAGVTRNQLNAYLADTHTGLYFPVDPGADASLGGMAATRASGNAAVRYGTMRENVLGLTVVLADGGIIRTGGRARKSSAGYDLTRLFVGSEGTLGIITEVTLKLTKRPEAVSAAVCAFTDINGAVDTAIQVITAGIPVARLEMLDEVQMGAINAYSGLDYKVTPTLLFEFHGSESAVTAQARAVGEIVQTHGGEDFQWESGEAERDRLWQARYDSYYATLALRPGSVGYVTDVCVPISRLAECIMKAKAELQGSPLVAPLFGHVGDGNFHVVFPLDPDNPDELNEAQRISKRIVGYALEMDGTCTGEHGIGLGKIDALEREHGGGVIVMRAIKIALDPQNIMNPGKVIRS